MFEIKNDEIHLTRGDKCVIGISIADYTFKKDDYVLLKVYKKKKLDKEPVLKKKVIASTETEELEIKLTSQETKIGELTNKNQEFWYEIELNGEQTVIGYDENGAKKLILYPEGADDINDNN